MGLNRAEFVAALPRKVLAAAALILDAEARALIVKPAYKPMWELPGGCVESGESARAACARECVEELGLHIDVGRLLVIEHQTLPDDKGDSLMFVYDGGVLLDTTNVEFRDSEVAEARWVAEPQLSRFLPLRQSRRLLAALQAHGAGAFIEMVNGEIVGG